MYNYIFGIILFVLYLFLKKDNTKSKIFFLLIIFILSINSFDNWLLLSHNYKKAPHIIKIPLLLFYLYWPITYFWVKLQGNNFKFKFIHLFFLLPAFYVFISSYSFYFKAGSEKLKELYNSPQPPSLILISMTYILIIIFTLLIYFEQKKEIKNSKLVKVIFFFNIIYSFIIILSFILYKIKNPFSVYMYYSRFSIAFILFFVVFYFLFEERFSNHKEIENDDNILNFKNHSKSNDLDNDLDKDLDDKDLDDKDLDDKDLDDKDLDDKDLDDKDLDDKDLDDKDLDDKDLKNKDLKNKDLKNKDLKNKDSQKYKRSRLSEEDSKSYLEKLIHYMEEEEAYKDIDLNLNKISHKLNIPTAYISQVLNEYLGENFYTFVNRYRIELAKKMLVDPKNDYLTILAIAYDSGFKSKATFNQNFKKITQMTPSVYRKQFQKKEVPCPHEKDI